MKDIQVFKEMVEDFYNSIPQDKKIEMYEQHLKDTKARNKIREEILKNKDSSKIDRSILDNSILLSGKRKKKKLAMNEAKESFYNLKPLKLTEFIKSKIALMIIDSNWNFLLSGGLTLDEIGNIYSISKERIRQIENRVTAFVRSLNALKVLNKDGKVEDILDIAYNSVNRKVLVK